ncbi:MAG: DUF2089 family protein [bacterium]
MAMKIDICPQCQSPLKVKKKECIHCGLQLEANFEESPLYLLSRDEQDFILEFILSGGNFKALGDKLGLTYPTLRNRLDRIISRLEPLSQVVSADQILDKIDKGELKPEEGIQQLKELKGKEK